MNDKSSALRGRDAMVRKPLWLAGRWLATGLVLSCGLAVPVARAQPDAAPVPVERFFQHPAMLEAKLSPSGRRVAISTSKGGSRVGLVVIELGEPLKATRAAAFSDADIRRFEWVSDERLVFSAVDLEAGSGEDRYTAPGLYAVNFDGAEVRELVRRGDRPYVSQATGSRLADSQERRLDWNHVLLEVPRQQEGVNPDEIIVGRVNFNSEAVDSVTPLWLNTRSGRTRSLEMGEAPAYAREWLFDSKGQPRMAITAHEGRAALYWRGPADRSWRRLVEAPRQALPFQPVVVDDSGTLFVTRPEGPEGYEVLTRFDFEAMAPQTPALVSAPGFDFSGGLVLDRAGMRALGVRVDTDGEQTVWFDEGMKRMQALADERLPGRINRLSCRRCGEPEMVVLVRSYSDREPGQLWLYEAGAQRWRFISPVMDGVDARRMAKVDFQRIKARDGRDLPVWLTLPQGVKPGAPAPAVVLVHGGPWVRGGHWRWEPMEQFLASRGYLVIAPEFRGSTGYGAAHERAGWKQWGRDMQDDVADALAWAQQRSLADKRACIAGGSYGGYATLMGLVRHPELYRCGVAWSAPADMSLLLRGSWWVDDDTSGETRRHLLPELVGDVDKDAELLVQVSPVAQAARIKAPLLLGYGEADRRVPPVHAKRLRSAMQAASREPEWVSYGDEGHGWRKVATRIDFARRIEQFLERNLKNAQP